jgi:trehalose 6-phosphate phosphatase
MLEHIRVPGTRTSPPALDSKISALFLDLDGTIADIVARPHEVGPEAQLTGILERVVAFMDGRVAVLTGRSIEDADRILEGRVVSVGAVHGLVRRMPDGTISATAGPVELLEAKRQLLAFARALPGVIVEDKGLSVALHYRQVPHAASAVSAAAGRIARAAGLVVQAGSMVSEVRTAGPDKGDSLKAFLDATPFAGFMPVMVGDDLTDECAFAAAEELGGYGILVGPPRASVARYRLASVAAVRSWLAGGAIGLPC